MKITFKKPIKGTYLDIKKIPDDVFSQLMLGPGFAVIPEDNKVYAPYDGQIVVAFPTGHAVAIKHENGLSTLIHVGINTVNLKGEGFNLMVAAGTQVKQGDLLLSFDLPFITKNATSNNVAIAFIQEKHCEILKETSTSFELILTK